MARSGFVRRQAGHNGSNGPRLWRLLEELLRRKLVRDWKCKKELLFFLKDFLGSREYRWEYVLRLAGRIGNGSMVIG